MDRKALLILLVSFVVLLGWYPLTNRLFPPQPVPANTNRVVSATNLFDRSSTGEVEAITTASSNLLEAAASAAPTNLPPAEEELLVVEDKQARYTFTSLGGGIKLIELKEYPEAVGCLGREPSDTNGMASLNTRAPVAAFSILEEGGGADPRSFHLSRTGNVVRAERQLEGGVHLVKEFHLSTNFLVQAKVRYVNRGEEAVRLPEEKDDS